MLAFDWLGFGKSPKPEADYSIQFHAKTLEALLTEFGEYSVHLVGNSWAPTIALEMSQATLKKLKSFTAIEGRFCVEDCGTSASVSGATWEEFSNEIFPQLQKKYSAKNSAYRLEDCLPRAYYQGSRSLLQILARANFCDRFIDLACPRSYFFSAENEKMAVLSRIPLEFQRRISAGGHFMMLDRPDLFYPALAECISSS